MEQEIYRLLRKRLTGDITKAEEQKLKHWEEQSQLNIRISETLMNVWKEESEEPALVNSDEMIDKIWRRGVGQDAPKQVRMDWSYFMKVAATFLIVLSSVLAIFWLNSTNQNIVEVSAITHESKAGQKKIPLPDGTVVWLNGSSKLIYTNDFNKTSRKVTLEGEGYFEVAKDPVRPFTVSAVNLETTALGTSFNINAYEDQDYITVSLITGSVRVNSGDSDIILEPGKAAVYERLTGNLGNVNFDLYETIGWKDGALVFRNASYHDFALKLERWFGIEVKTIGVPPQNWKLTTAYKHESLVNILRNISFGKPFQHELNQNELIINFSANE